MSGPLKFLLLATFCGAVVSFASLALVHERGSGMCTREARARRELSEGRRALEVAQAALVTERARADGLSRDLAAAMMRTYYCTERPEAVTPDGHFSRLAVTLDGRPVDELQFVDADIAAAFSGAIYLTGTPTQMQLARELRLTREEWSMSHAVIGRDLDPHPQVRCPVCDAWTFAGNLRPCSGCGGESPWVLAMRAMIAQPTIDAAREE